MISSIRLNGQVEKRKKKLSKEVFGTGHIISQAEAEYTHERKGKRLIMGTGQYDSIRLVSGGRGLFPTQTLPGRTDAHPKAILAWNKTSRSVIGLFHVTC